MQDISIAYIPRQRHKLWTPQRDGPQSEDGQPANREGRLNRIAVVKTASNRGVDQRSNCCMMGYIGSGKNPQLTKLIVAAFAATNE